MRDYDFDGEPFVVIERADSGIGNFLLGVAMGVGAALLFAPRSGDSTRRLIGESARRVGDTLMDSVNHASERVGAEMADIHDRVTDTVDNARYAVRRRQENVLDAIDAGIDAGRAAAAEARAELERRIAENKASRGQVGQPVGERVGQL